MGVFPIVPLFEITGKKVRKSVGQSGICFSFFLGVETS
jgi:hypothetical protein